PPPHPTPPRETIMTLQFELQCPISTDLALIRGASAAAGGLRRERQGGLGAWEEAGGPVVETKKPQSSGICRPLGLDRCPDRTETRPDSEEREWTILGLNQ
ncbi:hypothetical protein, partial [Nonomuraea sp. NPDC001023]|uniref:hypothetical protein n=1 Tax=Nonomuraea sp. NPDC001023 TaxID=3154770 RepID=UPI00332430F8